MRLLVDTHILLWQVQDDPRLKGKLRQFLVDTSVTIVVSDLSLWEVAIKVQCGKLRMSIDLFDKHIDAQGYERLNITRSHLTAIAGMQRHHKDPFDHLLIAQATVERIPILTANEQFGAYPIRLAVA